MKNQFNGCPHFSCSLSFIFIKLIVICRLWVIYVRVDNDSSVYIGYDYTAYMDNMNLNARSPRKAVG